MNPANAIRDAKRKRLRDDFAYYAAHCLKIRAKSGAIVPFTLNAVQKRVHEAAERQRAETGRIRLLVLKARQPGISTYVEGRLYWKTTNRKGVRAFILTHRDQATRNLFAIAKRFHDHVPPMVRAEVKASNATELDFRRLDSGYRIGTAKAEGVGRADTIQRIHGVTLLLVDAAVVKLGPDAGKLVEIDFREVADPMDAAVPLVTREHFVEFDGDYERDARIVIEGDAPASFTLLALAPELKTNEQS